MRVLLSVCAVLAVLTIVCRADEPEKKQTTIVGVTLVLVDTNTKGISGGKEIIKKIEIPTEIVAKNAMTVAKDNKGQEIKGTNQEWVEKNATITLKDGSVVEGRVLVMKSIGKTTLTNYGAFSGIRPVLEVIPVMREQGNGTWYGYRAKYTEPTDTSKENLAQTKKDMESLQGRWQSVKFSFFPDDKPGIKLVVRGNQFIFLDPKTGDEIPGFPFHLDPKTKAFDLRIGTPFGIGEVIGRYELKGDDFTFYMQEEEYGRPKALDDKGVLPMVVFKREKP